MTGPGRRNSAVAPMILAVALALPACATPPPLPDAAIRTVPDRRVAISRARISPVAGGLAVTGTIRRADMNRAALWGHLHIAARLTGAGRIVSMDTRWAGNLSARTRRPARFTALLRDVKADEVETVFIEYRTSDDTRDAAAAGRANSTTLK